MAIDSQSILPPALESARDHCMEIVAYCALLRALWDGDWRKADSIDWDIFDDARDGSPRERHYLADKFFDQCVGLRDVVAEARGLAIQRSDDGVPFIERVTVCHSLAAGGYPSGVYFGCVSAATYHNVALKLAENVLHYFESTKFIGCNKEQLRKEFDQPSFYPPFDERLPPCDYLLLHERIGAEADRAWREAARILGVSPKTLFNRRRAGKIGFVRDNGRILYRLAELERYSKANEVPAAV